MTASVLDEISGLGEVRRKALLRKFGSLRKLGAASVEEILEVPGIGRRTAEAIVAALTDEAPKTAQDEAEAKAQTGAQNEAKTEDEAEPTTEGEAEPEGRTTGESPTPDQPEQAAT